METGLNAPATRWDAIYVGASLLTLLDAATRMRHGQRVLMIDDQAGPGGAWRSLSLFGLSAIENAIHYFLPDEHGIRFMKQELGLNIVPSTGKYSVFAERCFGLKHIRYDSPFAEAFERAYRKISGNSGLASRFCSLLGLAADLARAKAAGSTRQSFYLSGGTPEIMACIDRLLKHFPVPITLGKLVTDITVNPQTGITTLSTREGKTFEANQVVITQSLKLSAIRVGEEKLMIPRESLPRPQIHLLVEDSDDSVAIREAIFAADPEIKYVHDITRYAPEQDVLYEQKRRVFALAVHQHIGYEPGLGERLARRMEAVDMLGRNARLLGEHYFVAELPGISEAALQEIQHRTYGRIAFLVTESFAGSMGRYSERWAGIFR